MALDPFLNLVDKDDSNLKSNHFLRRFHEVATVAHPVVVDDHNHWYKLPKKTSPRTCCMIFAFDGLGRGCLRVLHHMGGEVAWTLRGVGSDGCMITEATWTCLACHQVNECGIC